MSKYANCRKRTNDYGEKQTVVSLTWKVRKRKNFSSFMIARNNYVSLSLLSLSLMILSQVVTCHFFLLSFLAETFMKVTVKILHDSLVIHLY